MGWYEVYRWGLVHHGTGFCFWCVCFRRESAHLTLKQPLGALGVGGRVRPVTGGAARRAVAPLGRVSLAAARAAHGPGSASALPVSVSLAPLAPEGHRNM